MKAIYPSLISADLLNLEQEIKSLEPYCPGYHIDIMDNHFVPNLTWGASFVHAISDSTAKQMWVHIMVDNPDDWINKLRMPPGSILSFHVEATEVPEMLIKRILEKNWLPSLAVSPKTSVETILNFLNDVHHVLLMSVVPGFSGQKFLPEVTQKLEYLTAYRKQHNLDLKIGMDGGINKDNIAQLAQKGADYFAVASAIFDSSDPAQALQELNKLIA